MTFKPVGSKSGHQRNHDHSDAVRNLLSLSSSGRMHPPSHPERAATQRLIVAMHQFAAAAAAAAASSSSSNPVAPMRSSAPASNAERGVAKSQHAKSLDYNFLRRPF